MKCPTCGNLEAKVVDSRLSREGDVTRRRRECLNCGERFTTHERIETVYPFIKKKDGRREEFNRKKIMHGLDKAFEKRPISVEEKEAILARVARFVRERGEKEIAASEIGQKVMDEIREIDEVAYVRFASVYRSFKDASAFMEEISRLSREKP